MNVTDQQKVIKNKARLLRLAQKLNSVAKACKVMGFSRESFTAFETCMSKAASPPWRRSVAKSQS